MSGKGTTVLTMLAVVVLSATAHATPADTYGAMPQGVATAGAQTSATKDAGASYYNPAGLGIGAASGKTSIAIGYAAGMPSLNVDRTKNDGPGVDRHPTREPEYRGWQTLSALFPLGGVLEHKVAIGLLFYHPQDKLIRVQALSPRDPQWLRYESSTDRMELDIGFGAKVGRYVSFGAGVHVLAGLEGNVDFDIELFERRVGKRDLTFDLVTRMAPNLGLIVTPTDRWRVGFVFRGSNRLDISQPTILGLGDIGTLDLLIEGTVHYTPQQFGLGATFDVNERLSVSADFRYHRWSQAPHPAVSVKVGLDGEVPEGLGLDEVMAFETNDAPPGFQDVLVSALAVEYTFPDEVTQVRGGYAWRPSYVPDQVHKTNYLDASSHLLGVGATFRFHDPTRIFSQPLMLDIAAQGQFLQGRLAKKQGGDLVGDYMYGGFVMAASAALRYEF